MGGNATASSRADNTDISSKPRRRQRDGYFWQLIVLRIPVAFFAIAIIAYLVHYISKWQGAIRRPEDADDPLVTRKDARGQSGLAFGMVRTCFFLCESLSGTRPKRTHKADVVIILA